MVALSSGVCVSWFEIAARLAILPDHKAIGTYGDCERAKENARRRVESHVRQLVFSMYALAAGAAGVGVLTLGQLSEAKIIYTAAHEVIGFASASRLR
jgi:hypothetical protein